MVSSTIDMERFMDLDKVRKTDSDIAKYIDEELERQQNTIELIASENIVSKECESYGKTGNNKYK